MKLLGTEAGFARLISEPTVNRPGLALAGFYSYFAKKRIQVIGFQEFSFLESLPSAEQKKRFEELCDHELPCLIVCRGLELPAQPAQICQRRRALGLSDVDVDAEIPQCRDHRARIRLRPQHQRPRLDGRRARHRHPHPRQQRHRQKRNRARAASTADIRWWPTIWSTSSRSRAAKSSAAHRSTDGSTWRSAASASSMWPPSTASAPSCRKNASISSSPGQRPRTSMKSNVSAPNQSLPPSWNPGPARRIARPAGPRHGPARRGGRARPETQNPRPQQRRRVLEESVECDGRNP